MRRSGSRRILRAGQTEIIRASGGRSRPPTRQGSSACSRSEGAPLHTSCANTKGDRHVSIHGCNRASHDARRRARGRRLPQRTPGGPHGALRGRRSRPRRDGGERAALSRPAPSSKPPDCVASARNGGRGTPRATTPRRAACADIWTTTVMPFGPARAERPLCMTGRWRPGVTRSRRLVMPRPPAPAPGRR